NLDCPPRYRLRGLWILKAPSRNRLAQTGILINLLTVAKIQRAQPGELQLLDRRIAPPQAVRRFDCGAGLSFRLTPVDSPTIALAPHDEAVRDEKSSPRGCGGYQAEVTDSRSAGSNGVEHAHGLLGRHAVVDPLVGRNAQCINVGGALGRVGE